MDNANRIAELEAELMELKSRPRGIGDSDITELINERDRLYNTAMKLENAAGSLHVLVLMLCDDETSRPKMATARKVVDYSMDLLPKARIVLRDVHNRRK
jgi:hypothetical protein